MFCPQCGTVHTPGGRFCGNCGLLLPVASIAGATPNPARRRAQVACDRPAAIARQPHAPI